jgi:hypothetical protein
VIGAPAVRRPAARHRSQVPGWRAGVRAATNQALEHPSTWAVGLAGFLARGGIVLLLVPIVPLPSPVGLANLVGPTAATPSGPSPEAAGMLAAGTALLLAWLVLGTAVGALSDALLTQPFAGNGPRATLSPWLLGRLVGVRLAALVPLGLALAIAVRPIVEATYRQLISPYDLAVPLVTRVARDVAPLIALIVGAWLLAEVVGGLALRMIVLRNDSAVAAIGHALAHLVRRPITSMATAVLGLAGLALAIGPPMVAAAGLWTVLEASVAQGAGREADAGRTVLVGLCLVAVWMGGLLLCGLASAWRGLLWTAEVARSEANGRDGHPDVRRGPA